MCQFHLSCPFWNKLYLSFSLYFPSAKHVACHMVNNVVKWQKNYITASNMSDDEYQLFLRTANKNTLMVKYLNLGEWPLETASLFYWNPTLLCSSILDTVLGVYHSESSNLGKISHMVDFWCQWKQSHRVNSNTCQIGQKKVCHVVYCTALWRYHSHRVNVKSHGNSICTNTW